MVILSWILGIVLLIGVGGVLFYFFHPVFGARATGPRLQRMMESVNYRKGVFENLQHTPALKEGVSMSKVLWQFLFKKGQHLRPLSPIPAIKTDLRNLPDHDLLIWFGHSSYLMKIEGRIFLIDPVFGKNASPIPGSNRPFPIAVDYHPEDFPYVDYLLISHDHYDHLDYETINRLRSNVGSVYCGLGVGAHFERWGYAQGKLFEGDWGDKFSLTDDITLTFTPARHFSGRRFARNVTLWTSFVLRTNRYNLFLGGDSGYGEHFKKIGDQFGPFDLAILENGQYNDAWHYIHSLPDEVIIEAKELRTKAVLPVHAAKFKLALHDWQEPLERISQYAAKEDLTVLTPRIGEIVLLGDALKPYVHWWKELN